MTDTGFFAIGRKTFIEACDLGINPACALLVMACGTGRDNITTKWSAEAVKNHIGVRWQTANGAINTLLDHALVAIKPTKGTRPAYKLAKEGDLLWLPKTLVSGAGDEIPPITKLRQTQDAMTLRLLIELYSVQNLREDGGIRLDVYHRTSDRRKAGQQGVYTVWDFISNSGSVTWGDVSRPHYRHIGDLTEEELAADKNSGVDFFRRFDCLVSLGLVEWVNYLFEGKDGEPIHALACNSLPIEKQLYEAATNAASRMLTDGQIDFAKGALVPILTHIAEVQLIGMARLKYRPQTRLTGAWWAEHQKICQAFIDKYETLAMPSTGQKTGTFDHF